MGEETKQKMLIRSKVKTIALREPFKARKPCSGAGEIGKRRKNDGRKQDELGKGAAVGVSRNGLWIGKDQESEACGVNFMGDLFGLQENAVSAKFLGE